MVLKLMATKLTTQNWIPWLPPWLQKKVMLRMFFAITHFPNKRRTDTGQHLPCPNGFSPTSFTHQRKATSFQSSVPKRKVDQSSSLHHHFKKKHKHIRFEIITSWYISFVFWTLVVDFGQLFITDPKKMRKNSSWPSNMNMNVCHFQAD